MNGVISTQPSWGTGPCQHMPELHVVVRANGHVRGRVACARCGVATLDRVAEGDPRTDAVARPFWEDWAQLMLKETEARDRATKARDILTERTLEAGEYWKRFAAVVQSRAGGPAVPASPLSAAEFGHEVAVAVPVYRALKRHIKGPIDPKRIHDLFHPMRKACCAFFQIAGPNEPKEEK